MLDPGMKWDLVEGFDMKPLILTGTIRVIDQVNFS
jgi:hypothetical protein